MATFDQNIDSVGGMGMGGSWTGILLVVIVLALLFRGDFLGGHKDGYGAAGYGEGCMKSCRPTYYDESNWEEETHLKDKIDCQSEKTRALICHNQERADDKAYQALYLSNLQKDNVIQTLALEKNFDAKFGKVFAELEEIECKMPKTAPCFIEARPVELQRCGGDFDRRFEPRRCGDRD